MYLIHKFQRFAELKEIKYSIRVICVLKKIVKMRVCANGEEGDARELLNLHQHLHLLHHLHGLNVQRNPKEKNI